MLAQILFLLSKKNECLEIGLWLSGSQKHTNWSLVVFRFQGIEQLKKEERRWAKKTKWMNMRAVFGHPFSLLWFSPFSTPDHGKAETYQYVVWGGSHRLHCRPLTSHGQLFMCFSVLPTKCAMFIFVLPWVSRVAEKKKSCPSESCFFNTVMNLFVSDLFFLSVVSEISFLFCGSSCFSLRWLFQPNYKWITYSLWRLVMHISLVSTNGCGWGRIWFVIWLLSHSQP